LRDRAGVDRDRVDAAERQMPRRPDHRAGGVGGQHRPQDVVPVQPEGLAALDHRQRPAVEPDVLADHRP
jgi:hypothetical protein